MWYIGLLFGDPQEGAYCYVGKPGGRFLPSCFQFTPSYTVVYASGHRKDRLKHGDIYNTEAQPMKENIDKLDSIKMKNSALRKTLLRK